MIQILGVIFIAFVIIHLMNEDKKSSKVFYEKRIRELQSKNETLKMISDNLQKKLELLSVKPRKLNNRKITEEDYERAKAIVARKDRQYGRETTLEDFIVDSIKRHGYEKVKDIFYGLVKTYEIAGRDVSNHTEIYNHFFG